MKPEWYWRWVVHEQPWWRFWDPRSGGWGGLISGVLVWIVVLVVLAVLSVL